MIITTKLGGRPQPFDPQNTGALRESVEQSLRLLGRDTIDILMVHEPDRPQQYPWWTSYDPLCGPALELMDELKAEGKIRLNRLDEIAAMVPTRPYEEPMILPLGKAYYGPGIANMGAAVQVGKLELDGAT